ncbi:MAG: DUF2066 domain-containing protein [Aestuariibacter sp.]
MQRISKISCLLTLLLVCMRLAHGSIIDDLYQTRVEVSNQTTAEQRRAFQESLKQVLVKVSGDTSIVDHAFVAQQSQRARDFIRSYRYEVDKNLYLVADFDETAVNNIVTNSDFPIWGKRRPTALVWLAFENTQERRLVSALEPGDVKSELDRFAQRRGIRLTYPLMDIEDLSVVNVYDVWGRFDDVMREASQRYLPEATFSARLYKTDNTASEGDIQWQLDWQILESEIAQQGLFFADQQALVLQEFADMIADYLAERYAVDMSDLAMNSGQVPLYILNLDSIEAYANVVRFFKSLTMVSDIKLTRLNGSTGEFSLTLIGAPDDLIATLALDGNIRRKTDAFGRVGEQLEYFWNP